MDFRDGRSAKVDILKPVFIVVQAKCTSKLPEASSEAELMEQLTSQLICRYTSIFFLPFY